MDKYIDMPVAQFVTDMTLGEAVVAFIIVMVIYHIFK